MNRRHATTLVLSLTMLLFAAPGEATPWDGTANGDEAAGAGNEIGAGDRISIVIDRESAPGRPADPASWQQRIGTFESYRDGVLVFAPENSDGSLISVPIDQVRSLEVDRGKSNRMTEGLLIGLAVGLGIAIATQTGPSECEGFMCGIGEGYKRVGTGAAITLSGLVVGAAVGSAISAEDWQLVYDRNATGTARGRRFGEYEIAFGIRF